jgi:isopentenyl-diphosphate delta-isomerase
MEYVVLVDENDNEIGIMEKVEAHKNGGRLHRAISVFVFNDKGELLIQRRALTKYHAPGLWANTCCSHPKPGEDAKSAAERRLMEEMGFTCEVEEIFPVIYRADVGNGLTEYEYDHIFVGYWNGEPDPNPEEVCEWEWKSMDEIKEDMEKNPEKYAPWFRIIFPKVYEYINSSENP